MGPHVAELRKRLLISLAAVVLAALAVWEVKEWVLAWALGPVHGTPMLATAVAEVFWVYLKIALWGGLLLGLPVFLCNLWRFIRPGLLAPEARWLAVIILGSPTLLLAGMLFAHTVLMPLLVSFFLGYTAPGVAVQPSLSAYISLWLTTLFTFGVAFNFPIFLLLLMRAGVVQAGTLGANRRFVVVFIFIIAAVATPPDPVSQLLLAAPLLVLFEATLLMAKALGLPTKTLAK